MSVTKKALLIWWSMGGLMLVLAATAWKPEAERLELRDLSLWLGWLAIWSWYLVKLTKAHKNSKNEEN